MHVLRMGQPVCPGSQSISENFAAGILPYYLHMLDRVRGAAHFQGDQSRAQNLVMMLRERLPGYLVPRLAREEQGAAAKTLIL